ncbi:ead/Ea22-like family protein [Escherichia coli]
MSNIDKRALRHSAESIIGILENIAGFEPSDIDGDSVELRFETEDGFDTGCDVSIVDQCQKTADVVRALLDELERNQQYIKRRDQKNEDIALTVGKLRVELEAVQKTSAARIEAIDRTHKMFQREKDRADAAEKCIAELSASHSKLRDTMAGIHNTIRMDGGYTPLAAILNAAKRAYEESASAAGIRIKGE